MNLAVAVFLFGIGVWIITAAMKIHLDDVRAASELPKEEYRSQVWMTFALLMVGSTFICCALTLIVQFGVNL